MEFWRGGANMLPDPLGFNSLNSTNMFIVSSDPTTFSGTTDWMILGSDGGRMTWESRVPLEVPPAAPRLNWRNGAEPDSIRGKSIFSKKKS